MKFFPSDKVFLQIGSVMIRWYAVLIITGAFVAYYFIKKDLKEMRLVKVDDFMDDFFVSVLWTGVIGARLWYCLFEPSGYYFSHPIDIIKIYDGGLAIHGGIAVGMITAYFVCKKKNVSFIRTLDCVLPNVLIAQAIGRWGNFINRECYGPIVEESFFDGILSFIKEGMYIGGAYRMPMFFFESALCLLGFLIIRLGVKKLQNKRGDLAWAYMIWYGLVRFFIEGKRTDSLMISTIKTAQLTSVIIFVVGILGYLGVFEKLFKKKKPTIIFDLDNTLVNTSKAIVESYRELFKKHDDEKNFTKEKQTEVLGPALHELFPKYFPGLDYDKLFDEYHEVNNAMQEKCNKPMENAELVLKTLKEEGYNIGIVSTKRTDGCHYTLGLADFDKYIDDICGFEKVTKVKPNPEAYFKIINDNKWNSEDVIVIGDSTGDIEGGYNYGAYTIAYHAEKTKDEQLNASHANAHINDLKDVLDIVKEDHHFTYNLK